MGILTAKKFLQHIDVDNKLQVQVNDVAWNIEPLVAIATSNGYAITCHDLQTAMDELWGVLSEEDLRNAAGGGGGNGNNGNNQGNNGNNQGNNQGNTALSACSFYYNS